ncbi:MAG: hypothetical protein RJA36_2878 [Pseudomonadota bacterium]|jgi:methylmalonyl-CoA decarboxylase
MTSSNTGGQLITVQEPAPGIASLTMTHDAKRNALSAAMLEQISAALRELEAAGVRAVLLRARAGAGVWSAGHSLDELSSDGHDPLNWQDPLRRIVREIEHFPAPIIAMIEGTVWGGACELSFACDLIVATPQSTFAATPARLGVPYNPSGLQTFLNAAHLRIAMEMLFTAQPIAAARLAQYGIINQLVEADQLEPVCLQLAQAIAGNAPLAVAVMKEQLRTLANAQAIAPVDFERIQWLRRLAYGSQDYSEGVHALREHRRPDFHGR